MRVLAYNNGWKDAPHCWKTFLFKKPVNISRYAPKPFPFVIHVSFFGFSWFFGI